MTGGFVKIYGSILESSIWSEDPWTRLLWVTMLAMADPDGEVMASVPGLARRANIPVEECRTALGVLSSPDKEDRSKVEEGRRIREIPGGWLLINYQRYRDMRTEEQAAKAERQKRWRNGRREASRVDDVDAGRCEVSSSSSAVVVDLEGEVQEREIKYFPLLQFCEAHDFGPFEQAVIGLVMVQRHPDAVLSTLQMHLDGELGHEKCGPRELGLACQQFLASVDRWNSAYFAGFVRRAKGKVAQAREAEHIAREDVAKHTRQAEETAKAEARRNQIDSFGTQHPDRYAQLRAAAEDAVGPGRGRGLLVQGKLYELVEEEVDASS